MSDDSDLIQSVYAVTVDPERYDDLVVTWVEKLSTALFAYQDNPEDADSAALNAHVERATKVISLLAASRSDDLPGAPTRADVSSHPTSHPTSFPASFPDAQPVIRINAAGKILDTNASARRAYDASNAERLGDLPFDTAGQRTIHALARKLLRTTASESKGQAVSLVQAVRTDNQQTVYLSLSADLADAEAVYLTSSDIVWPDRLTGLMKDSFSLTTAECEVGKGLVEGKSLNDIADSRHTSISTVRVHARSLFSKTSTNGQREFIRMAIGLAALYPDEEDLVAEPNIAATAVSRVVPDQEEWLSFRLRDGRQIPYAFVGQDKGPTCLYVHDALFGPALPRTLAELATSAGLRFLLIARQGWRGAALYPEGSNAFEQCAKDTSELLDHLKLDNLLLVGRVIGGTYGFEIVRHDPKRYIGYLGIAPSFPIGEREDINRMAPHHRLLTISVGANPSLLKFVFRAGLAIYDRFGPERFLRMLYRTSPKDLALVDDPDHLATMAAGLALGRETDDPPFYHELKQRPSEAWHPGLEMPVPYHALLGDQDPSARRRRAERMIKLGVPLQLTLLPDCGELIIYSHPEVIVGQILQMFDTLLDVSTTASSN